MNNREIDALIAEKLFNWLWFVNDTAGSTALLSPHQAEHVTPSPRLRPALPGERPKAVPDLARNLPLYSQDMSSAWDVVAQMLEAGYRVKIIGRKRLGVSLYSVGFDAHYFADGAAWIQAEDESCARAICLAALYSIGAIDDTGYLTRAPINS